MKIWCYPLVAANDEDFVGIAAGETIEQNPHEIECAKCGKRQMVFDAEKHGYDGALGHGSSYSHGSGGMAPISCSMPEYGVDVVFTYNAELEELRDIGTERGIEPQDLFDWFHLIAINDDGVELKDINYECA